MSSIVTEQGILHYESIGRGKPLILLHGWINSWDVWRDSMVTLSSKHQLRIYALDFWGFGDSAKSQPNSFQLDSYVDMVHQFMENLGIIRSPIFGHSMGGTVALKYALRYPDRTTKVAVVGSPIVGSSLNFFLKLSGYGWIADLVWRYPFIRDMVMKILLAGDSREVRSMISRDVQRANMQSFFRSIASLRDTDLRDELGALHMPALGIYGRRDNIVSPQNAETFRQVIQSANISLMERSRHFPMIDEPERFIDVIVNFLEDQPQKTENTNEADQGNDVNNLQVDFAPTLNGSKPHVATNTPLTE